ncbi:MAG: hypothetical protein P1V97_38245, partial [Planctomycetota bacterium]|nr:hypothetical protein [Planctomycetota bacterium]
MATRKATKKKAPSVEDIEAMDTEIPELTYTSSTKKTLWAAYNKLVEKVKNTESGGPSELVRKQDENKLVAKVLDSSVESIVQSAGALKLGLNRALDDISQKMLDESGKLASIEQAIEIEEKRLEELHDIQVAAETLQNLLAEHDAAKESFEELIASRKEEVEASLKDACDKCAEHIRLELEQFEDQTTQKAALWEKEQKLHEESVKERDAELAKQRTREEEEYNYKLTQARMKDKDSYEARQAELEEELLSRKQKLEHEFSAREEAIKAHENELAKLREQAQNFPEQLKAAVAHAEKETIAEVKREAKVAADLNAQKAESEQELLQFKVSTLESKIGEQQNRILELTQQLDVATAKVQDIA